MTEHEEARALDVFESALRAYQSQRATCNGREALRVALRAAFVDYEARTKPAERVSRDTRPCPWYGCRHHLGLDERAGKHFDNRLPPSTKREHKMCASWGWGDARVEESAPRCHEEQDRRGTDRRDRKVQDW